MKRRIKIGIFTSSDPLCKKKKRSDYSFLKSKGFIIDEADNVRKKEGHSAGTIKERIRAINKFLKDDSIDILMAYWGGANTNEILPYLDYDLFRKKNKKIIGFSDTTALLLAVNKISGIKTYMGPAGITFDKPDLLEYSYEYFKKILIEDDANTVITDSSKYADDRYYLKPDSRHRMIKKNSGRKIYRHGTAQGEVIAANLQTLLVLAGTEYFPNLKDKILFVEEDENADTAMTNRFFTHLSQAVDLISLKGICIGRFSSDSGFNNKDSEEMIYKKVFSKINIPIIYNLDFGHTDPMFTIPIGGKVFIDTKVNIIKFFK